MSLINELKKEVITQLSSITNVQEVSDYEKSSFSGYPAITVTCSGNENEFNSTGTNLRTFMFDIRCYEQIEKVPQLDTVSDKAKARAEAIMGDLVSEVVETFDKFYEFAQVADFMEAVPSEWGYVKINGGWCRTARVSLMVKKEFNYQ